MQYPTKKFRKSFGFRGPSGNKGVVTAERQKKSGGADWHYVIQIYPNTIEYTDAPALWKAIRQAMDAVSVEEKALMP